MDEPFSIEGQLVTALRRINRAVELHSRMLLLQHGLTGPQLAALQAVSRLQPVPIVALARAIHLSQATLTGILSRLESRELVTRRRADRDRRSVVVELTPAGRSLLDSAPSLLQNQFRERLDALADWEQTQLLSAVQRLAAMMEDDARQLLTEIPERVAEVPEAGTEHGECRSGAGSPGEP